MMSAGHDRISLCLLIAEILHAVEQIKMAHRHLEIVLLLVCIEDRLEPGFFAVHVGKVPVGRFECGLDAILTADEDEVDHVAQIAEVVMNSTRKTVDVLAKIGVQKNCRGFHAGRSAR